MPPVRLAHRRRSSLAVVNVKSGYYGVPSSAPIIPPRPIVCTFAPNVTPISYSVDTGNSASGCAGSSRPPSPQIFPACDADAPPPSRRRNPPGKRRSQGYIPRPPNAFMLFRADFVRQKHVPGSIETNHGSLSKIIGNCWRALPLEEKGAWEYRAKIAKAEHKRLYPEYRFRPVHNKNKEKKEKPQISPEGERRCEEVAQLLLDGMKGDQLSAAVRNLDKMNAKQAQQSQGLEYDFNRQTQYPRRPSSVPLPDMFYGLNNQRGSLDLGLSFPLPSCQSRSATPIGESQLTRAQRMMYGQRRASTVQPIPSHSWANQFSGILERDPSPLPDVDTSLFQPEFLQQPYGGTSEAFNFHDFSNTLPHYNPVDTIGTQLMSPLDTVSPHDPYFSQLVAASVIATHQDNHSWAALPESSNPSTSYSGSPSSAFSELPVPLHAPQPVHAAPPPENHTPTFNLGVWSSGGASSTAEYDYSPQSEPVPDFHTFGLVGQSHQQPPSKEDGFLPEQSPYGHVGFTPTMYNAASPPLDPTYFEHMTMQQSHCGSEQQQQQQQQYTDVTPSPNIYVADNVDVIYAHSQDRLEFNDLIHGY